MQSGNFAKMVMKRPIERMISEVPAAGFRVSTFVDDVAQSAFGSAASVSRSSAIAAVSFCASMKALRLRVSDKTVIVASDPKIAARLLSIIKRYPGVRVRATRLAGT